MTAQKVETFRRKLQSIIDNVETCEDFGRGVVSVVRALKADYDHLFPQQAWDPTNHTELRKLMEQYCIPDARYCPICGHAAVNKVSNKGRPFWGCIRYPLCTGSRALNGRATLNDGMRDFLAKKVNKENSDTQAGEANRFKNLEL